MVRMAFFNYTASMLMTDPVNANFDMIRSEALFYRHHDYKKLFDINPRKESGPTNDLCCY